jgi:hypothetical protein
MGIRYGLFSIGIQKDADAGEDGQTKWFIREKGGREGTAPQGNSTVRGHLQPESRTFPLFVERSPLEVRRAGVCTEVPPAEK